MVNRVQRDPQTFWVSRARYPIRHTDLARLCRYYLACLGYDDTGVSTFMTSRYGDPDYFEVKFLPHSPDALTETDACRRLLGRKRAERGRYGLYFGYPTNIFLQKSRRSDWRGYMVEPLLLFPIQQEAGRGSLIIDLGFPIINQKPFQRFTNVQRDMLMNEIVELEQELGLNIEESRVEIDDVAMRLQQVRPEWPWKEDIDPSALCGDRRPLAEIDAPGIYNRAIVLMAKKSPFTQGLEKELRNLAQLPEAKYASTSLGRWIKGQSAPFQAAPFQEPIIEVLPMNSEQRQAVSAGLTRPITIITGPPGTGKSQVVTNLLANAAWYGKRVLFASKNNKAVDVVETRINALGSRPVLLRVGANAYQARLAQYVLALLSSTTTNAEQDEFSEAKATHERLGAEYVRLSEEMKQFVQLRNDVDEREQLAESARQLLGPDLFACALKLDSHAIQRDIQSLTTAVNRATRDRNGFLIQLLWPTLRKRRIANVMLTMKATASSFHVIGVKLPPISPNDSILKQLDASLISAAKKLDALTNAARYQDALETLKTIRPLEEIAHEESRLSTRIARYSATLWKLWLRLQPSMLAVVDRQKLEKYTSLLKMLAEAGDEGQLSREAYSKYSSMMRDVSHLLPCWAVTSLSARGRIPLEPCNFDLVIFDEASQCDIASALPLLYRAKSVVVIGDPKQLSHISGLQRGQDQALLKRYDLTDNFLHWAYSHQSLFDLGITQVSGDDVVGLVDHHRSHADIIGFSNEEFYEGRLRVATNYDNLHSPNRSKPGVRWIDVKGNCTRLASGGAVNLPEIKAVIAALQDLTIIKNYKGSVGVVTPFRGQANAISEAINQDDQLRTALVQREFLADTVHKFQGDERDVMIFSPVLSTGFPNGALGFLRSNGNLFNVAVTRARAQLIVVGDLAACELSDVGYLSRFATYAASLEIQSKEAIDMQLQDLGSVYPKVDKPENVSDWEREFYVAAYKDGLRLIPQYPIEKYTADFLMVENRRKLVIEIDGERYHRNWTGELCRRDQIRTLRLNELGYDVVRFWVYEVRDDLEGCFRRLKNWQDRQ